MEARTRSTPKIREVRKRDSRIVPFDPTKIADAIYAAFRAVGAGDRAVAEELASAVTHFLEEKFAGSLPGIEDIQDQVETVLIEMGHARVAKEYILYRQKRATLRETLQVRKEPGRQGEGITYDFAAGEADASRGDTIDPLPEVDRGQEGISKWHKSRIAAALIREADLDPELAGEIASAVERKVLNSGVRRISTSFLRELVDNELFERGYSAKLHQQAPLGIPKYNLESLIFGTDLKEGFTFPKTPVEIRNAIANRVLHQYSLEEVFTPNVADAHREGRIFIHRLSDPTRLARLHWRLPPPSAAAPAGRRLQEPREAPGSYLDLRDFFRRLWHLAHFFSEEIRLSNLSNLLIDPALHSTSSSEKARAVLDRLGQMDERPAIALELDLLPESQPWLEGILAYSQVRPGRFLIALRLRREVFTRPGGGAALDAVAALYERGERMEFLPPAEPRVGDGADSGATPGQPRHELLDGTAAKITLNLPRAAYRSARESKRTIELELEEVADLAVRGHLERRRFIERLSANAENPLWSLTGRPEGGAVVTPGNLHFTVGLVGLNECVKLLSGEDLHIESGRSNAGGRLGLELVKVIERKLRREERGLGIRLELEETANVGPLRILERSDRRKYPDLIGEVERGRSLEWGALYTDGARLHRMAPLDPLRRVEELAGYLKYLRPAGGITEDLRELRGSPRELLVSLLEECMPHVA